MGGASILWISYKYTKTFIIALISQNTVSLKAKRYTFYLFSHHAIMPDFSYESLNQTQLTYANQYIPGYDWVKGKFGPLPGVPRDKKKAMGRLIDKMKIFAKKLCSVFDRSLSI